MSEPTQLVQTDLLVNAQVATEDLHSHGLISDVLSPADTSNAA
jgi:hypothetical protein